MECRETRGEICVDGAYGFTYHIATIIYTIWEDDTFRYVLKPDYSVMDLLEPPLFQGIPGFDLSKRKKEYVRESITPTFISERAPAENREDLWKLLADVDMSYLNKLEWLIRTDTRYIGDSLYVRRLEDRPKSDIDISDMIAEGVNTENSLKQVLSSLCRGDSLVLNGKVLSAGEKKEIHDLLLMFYAKSWSHRESRRLEGIEKASREGAYAGRKRKPIDELVLRETIGQYKEKRIGVDEAAEKLGVSVSTFFRRMKELGA